MLPLLLASSSVYRRELLARLHLPFICSSPDIDESHRPGESAIELVKRLAEEKARALAASHPAHLIIGSDQVAVLGEQIIGKPHTFEKAREQLLAASGASVTFLTGLALLNSQTGHCQVDCVPFTVHMRTARSRAHRALPARRTALRLRRQLQGRRAGREPVSKHRRP